MPTILLSALYRKPTSPTSLRNRRNSSLRKFARVVIPSQPHLPCVSTSWPCKRHMIARTFFCADCSFPVFSTVRAREGQANALIANAFRCIPSHCCSMSTRTVDGGRGGGGDPISKLCTSFASFAYACIHLE